MSENIDRPIDAFLLRATGKSYLDIKQLESELSACRKELEEAKRKLAEAKNSCWVISENHVEACKQIRDLTAERNRLANELEEAIVKYDRLNTENEEYQEKIIDLESDCDRGDLRKALMDEFTANPPVPAGWKMVPIEPSDEMAVKYYRGIEDFSKQSDGNSSLKMLFVAGYKAMLSDTPEKDCP